MRDEPLLEPARAPERLGFTGTRDGATTAQLVTLECLLHERRVPGGLVKHALRSDQPCDGCGGQLRQGERANFAMDGSAWCDACHRQGLAVHTRGGVFHHGGARGADKQALAVARRLGWVGREHTPRGNTSEWLLARNRRIVASVDELVACPRGFTEELRSGTWATVRYAREAGIPRTIIWPDGTTTREQT